MSSAAEATAAAAQQQQQHTLMSETAQAEAPTRTVSGREQLASAGFGDFLGDAATSDAVVSAGGREFRVHRVLLMRASPFFRSAFARTEMREGASARVDLRFGDPHGVFPLVLAWAYGADVALTLENVVAVAAIAHQLSIAGLEAACAAFVADSLSPQTAVALLHAAVAFEESRPLGILDVLVAYIAENFQQQSVRCGLSALPLCAVTQILGADALNADEDAVFDAARDYVAACGDELTSAEQEEVWRCLRLPLVSTAKLREAQRIAGFPQDFLVEALLLALEAARGSNKHQQQLLQSPIVSSRTRHHHHGGGGGGGLPTNRLLVPRLPQRVLEVRRFAGEPEMAHGGWTICNRNRDAICFVADRTVALVGIGALEGDAQQVVEATVEVQLVAESKVLLRHTARYQSRGGKEPVQLLFPQPVVVKRGQLHCIEVVLHGKERLFSGTKGAATVCTQGVTFTFSETERSTNGTTIVSGQIPSLFVRLSFGQLKR